MVGDPAAAAFERTLGIDRALRIRGDLRLDISKILSIVPAQQRAATTQTPRRWARGASRSGSVSVITTHALFALKVQRKVSNGIAGLPAAGSSRHRQKIAQRASEAPQRLEDPAHVNWFTRRARGKRYRHRHARGDTNV